MTDDQRETLRRIERRLRAAELAITRTFGPAEGSTLAEDLAYIEIAGISVDGQPLEQIEAQVRQAAAQDLARLRIAIERAVAEAEVGT